MELMAAGLFALFIWWFSTGAILYVDGLPHVTHGWSLWGITVLCALALAGLAITTSHETPFAAYAAFVCAILCWGWQEMTLYLGVLTGPRRVPADAAGQQGWERLNQAVQAILYHEIAILVMGLVIVTLTWTGANQIGMWTYMVLWWMRLSAKMNIFLGVPNHMAEFLPDDISYLQTYFRKLPMNPLFPVSITISTVITAYLFYLAALAPAGSFDEAGYALLATLMALAVIEHWFLVLPIPVTKLWSWGLSSREPPAGNVRNDNAGSESREGLFKQVCLVDRPELTTTHVLSARKPL